MYAISKVIRKILQTPNYFASMGPLLRHLLRVEHDVLAVDNCRYFECATTWHHIEVRVVIVLIWDQLRVDIFFKPRLGYFIHHTDRVGYDLYNFS